MASQLLGANASLNAPGGVPGAAPTVVQGVLVANSGIVNNGGMTIGSQLVVTGNVPGTPQIVASNGLAGPAQGKVELFGSTDGTSSSVRLTDNGNVGVIEFIGSQAPAGGFSVSAKPTAFNADVTITNGSLSVNNPSLDVNDITLGTANAAADNYATLQWNAGGTGFTLVGVGANTGGFPANSITTRVGAAQLEYIQWGGTLDSSLKGVDVPSRYTRGLTVNSGSLSEEDLTIGQSSVAAEVYNTYSHWSGPNKFLHVGAGANSAGFPANAYTLYGVFNNATALQMVSYSVPSAVITDARVAFSAPVNHTAANQSGTSGDIASGTDVPVPGITATSVIIATMEASSTAPAAGVAFMATPVANNIQFVFPGGGTARFNWFVAKY